MAFRLATLWDDLKSQEVRRGVLIAVIATALIAACASLWAGRAHLIAPVAAWFGKAQPVTHGSMLALGLFGFALGVSLVFLARPPRRRASQTPQVQAAIVMPAAEAAGTGRSENTQVESEVEPKAESRVEPRAHPEFDPDSFTITPPRSRALLALLHRVDAITSLYELHQQVTNWGPLDVDVGTSKAQVQHDMEDAERAGFVTIDRVGTYTQHFKLTAPEGRDWVLLHQEPLQAEALKGLRRRDPRSPYGGLA